MKMRPPAGYPDPIYNGRSPDAQGLIEVEAHDVEALAAEGWQAVEEPSPPAPLPQPPAPQGGQ